MELVTIKKRNSVFAGMKTKIFKSRYLMLMALPAIIFYFIFNYIPMYGILIAFQKYMPKKGIWGSPWVGFKNFDTIFHDPGFWSVLKNTVLIGGVKIIIAFLSAVLMALLLNELRKRK